MSQRKPKEHCVFSESNPELRNIIEKYHGVFSFSENQQLFCNFCRLEIVISDEKNILHEVNEHISGTQHSSKVKVFREKDNRKRNASLLDALKDETLICVSDGLVRCTFCDVLLNDSLTNLKNHLVSLDHIFKIFGFGTDTDGNLKRKSARMIYLVAQTAELDFHKENDTTKILCKRCEYIIEPTYQSVKYHIDSKRHIQSFGEIVDGSATKNSNNSGVAVKTEPDATPETKIYKSRKPKTRSAKRLKLSEEVPVVMATETTVIEPVPDIEVQPEMITLSEDSFFVVEGFSFSDQHSFDQIIVTSPAEEHETHKPSGTVE